MDHFFKSIDGWFEESDKSIYDKAVQRYQDNDIFVEIGGFKGRSTSIMGINILNSKKNIKFYCVDTWDGSEEHQDRDEIKDKELYNIFIRNIEPIKDYIIPVRKKSIDAAKDFENGSLSFVYIDASHDYQNVTNDLESWYPKLKSGGTLAGHDWKHDEVRRAVLDFSIKYNLMKNGVAIINSWEIIL